MTLLEIKKHIREPYAFPGGYEKLFITRCGEVIRASEAKNEWCNIVWDYIHDASTGYRIDAITLDYGE